MDYKDNFQEMIARYNRELMTAWEQRQKETPVSSQQSSPPFETPSAAEDTRPRRPLYEGTAEPDPAPETQPEEPMSVEAEEPAPPAEETPTAAPPEEPALEELQTPPPLAEDPPEILPAEDPVPPPQVRPVTQVPMEVGYLQVWTTTAGSALPVAGAHVTVEGGVGTDREVHYIGLTDESGRTPVIPLPAAGRQLSLSPEKGDGQPPYTLYNISVYAEGYYRVENIGLPMYGGVLAVQPVGLIPLPEYGDPGDTVSYEDSAPEGLEEVTP